MLVTKAAIEIGADTLAATGISDVVRRPIVAEEIATGSQIGDDEPRNVAAPALGAGNV